MFKELLVTLGFSCNDNVFKKHDIVVTFRENNYSVSSSKQTVEDVCDRERFSHYTDVILFMLMEARGITEDDFDNAAPPLYTGDINNALISFVLYETGHIGRCADELDEYGGSRIFDLEMYDEFLPKEVIDKISYTDYVFKNNNWCFDILKLAKKAPETVTYPTIARVAPVTKECIF